MPYVKGAQAPMGKLQAQPQETPEEKAQVEIRQITTDNVLKCQPKIARVAKSTMYHTRPLTEN